MQNWKEFMHLENMCPENLSSLFDSCSLLCRTYLCILHSPYEKHSCTLDGSMEWRQKKLMKRWISWWSFYNFHHLIALSRILG